MTKIKEVVRYLESIAPTPFQESYDNSGLIVGNANAEVSGILITLDSTEAVVEEAMEKGCNLIIAHHPIVFRGLKKITGRHYVERVIIKAIKHDVAIYAIHTNLDNVAQGVNKMICEKIGLQNLRILAPKNDTLSKLVTFVPEGSLDKVMDALNEAGAGAIGNYEKCSFRVSGTGTFQPNDEANPHIGERNQFEEVKEDRLEVMFPSHLEGAVLNALKSAHPYEEVAYYFTKLTNQNQEVGSGMIGELPAPMEPHDFLLCLKDNMQLKCIRHTELLDRTVKRVAVCGGAGSFLLPKAISKKADVFVTADFKYHEFFDADQQIVIADIGHYESEVFTKDLLHALLTKKFTNFALNLSGIVTNPISYI
ncbi:MAG: Nif3-like dinuclear metal center hexameric protein [Bacteroidota bacterium]